MYRITSYNVCYTKLLRDEDFELSKENFTSVHLPNEENFFMDDREEEPQYASKAEPCMTDCKAEVKITKRAAVHFTVQTCHGIEYLHERGIIHRVV